ncbi:MAG: hypothetical protein M0Q38_07655 [Bacteroidales bacterium]|jgi:hypothetical protein|nr:hypothetical protein [Bacteroidales bacterium]
MLIYLFRITSDEHEDFLREIEIQPKQTFLDFHEILIESAELIHCERASFFMTDKKYKKDKEITLKTYKRQVRKYDEDLDQVVTETVALPLMKNAKLNQYIEDPHQKMIYEFVGKEHHSFFIDLFKILHSDGLPSYPRCIKRTGELPKQPVQPFPIASKPETPKITIPKIIIPKPEELAKLDNIVEDESELAIIENELENLLVEETAIIDAPKPVSDDDEAYSYGEEKEEMEHIEDYDDIESLDKRYYGFDQESDDF